MDQLIRYRHNTEPSRGLAAAGFFFVKWILAVPHLIIVSVLSNLAGVAGYIGFWIVAFTGRLPDGLQSFITMYLRWNARIMGWLAGLNDGYPPFEPEPQGYLPDVEPPRNDAPSKGWAVAGIFVPVKFIALLPHLIILAVLGIVTVIAVWFGYAIAMFTGELPTGIQNLVAGLIHWSTRVYSFFYGLTDDYPPFALDVHPTD